jgi:diguanylate cyclase
VNARDHAMNSAQMAKATLLRLAQGRLEPTPDNYARAWIEAGGPASALAAGDAAASAAVAAPPDDARQWAQLVEQLLHGLERGSRQWTAARKKEGIRRVIDGSRGHPGRLRQRLTLLVQSWQQDLGDDAPVEALTAPAPLPWWPRLRPCPPLLALPPPPLGCGWPAASSRR